jgi:hypothetical protein
MDDVAALLKRFKLEIYITAFETNGYDDLSFILQMDATQEEQLIKDVGFKPGEAAKYRDYIAVERILTPMP